MSINQAFRDCSYGPLYCRAAATTGAGTGAEGLKSKTVLKIYWRLSSKYFTTEELMEPEATKGARTSAITGLGARVAAGARVQQLLPSVGVLPASLSLPS